MSFRISLLTSASAAALGAADALSFAIERAREAEAVGVDDIWLNQGISLGVYLDGLRMPPAPVR